MVLMPSSLSSPSIFIRILAILGTALQANWGFHCVAIQTFFCGSRLIADIYPAGEVTYGRYLPKSLPALGIHRTPARPEAP